MSGGSGAERVVSSMLELSFGGTEATGISGRALWSLLASCVFESVYFSFYDAPRLPQVNKL